VRRRYRFQFLRVLPRMRSYPVKMIVAADDSEAMAEAIYRLERWYMSDRVLPGAYRLSLCPVGRPDAKWEWSFNLVSS